MAKASDLTVKQARFVACYLGPARGVASTAARMAGYAGTPGTLAVTGHRTLNNANVAAAVEAGLAAVRDDGAAIQRVRLAGKQERLARCWQTIDSRAARARARLGDDVEAVAAQAARRVFGGNDVPAEALTGLLVERETVNNAGHRTVEWAVDTGLLKEMRELEDDIASEVGEAPSRKVDVRHSGEVGHTHRVADFSALSLEEQFALDQMLAKATAAGDAAG